MNLLPLFKTITEHFSYLPVISTSLHPRPKNTAILLFSRSARGEAVHKPFFGKGRKKSGYLLAHGLVARSRQLCRLTGFPFFHLDEKFQTGDSFGQRLSGAMQLVFSKGYQKIIVIGNDCPGLTSSLLQQAAAHLETHDWVLGPSVNGGVYLIGLTASHFNQDAFNAIAWQTASVFTELKTLAERSSPPVYTLPVLHDVNTANDFIRLAKRYGSILPWLRSLLAQLQTRILLALQINNCPIGPIASSIGRRGPPLSFSCHPHQS